MRGFLGVEDVGDDDGTCTGLIDHAGSEYLRPKNWSTTGYLGSIKAVLMVTGDGYRQNWRNK